MANRTKATPKKKEQFLTKLAETANVTLCAKSVRLNRNTLYEWRSKDEAFGKAWDEAVERGTDALEDEAVRRAAQGVEEPVFYQGQRCGKIKRYSDTLLIFLLKARRPEKYKERHEIEGLANLAEEIKAARLRAETARKRRHRAAAE